MASDDVDLFARDLKRVDDLGSVVFTVCMASAVSGAAVAFAVSDVGERVALAVLSVVLGVAAMLAVPDAVLGPQGKTLNHRQYLAVRMTHVFAAQLTLLSVVVGGAIYAGYSGMGLSRALAAAGAGATVLVMLWVATPVQRREINRIKTGEVPGEAEKAPAPGVNEGMAPRR